MQRHISYGSDAAYTRYAFFEWSLIGLDILFDSFTLYDFAGLEVRIVDTRTTAPTSHDALQTPLWAAYHAEKGDRFD